MKILVLEHPRMASRDHFNDIANTPLWSCLMGGYAAAALKTCGRDEVTYLDAAGRGLTFEAVLAEILRQNPDLLCINAVYFWEHTPALFTFLMDLRRRGFVGHINLFGFFPTQVYREILSDGEAVDSVAIGECEHTLAELAGRLREGKTISPVAGLASREAGEGMPVAARPPARDPDEFPFPVRDPDAAGTLSILGSRGCYNHCIFCPIPGFYNGGPLWRGRSPENIVAEISGLVHAGHKDFYFADPNFVGPGSKGRERIMDLCGLLAPLDITFGMETRPGDLTAGLLAALRRTGLASLLLGVESGSAAQLEAIHKAQAPEVTQRAIRLCRQAGIEPEIGFIMFLADTTLPDIRAGLAFLKQNRLLDRLDRTVNLLSHRQIVLKGTTGYAQYLRQGRLDRSGCYGFQGQVPFKDQRVAWLAQIWLPVCRHILMTMSQAASPIFWNNPAADAFNRVNREVTVRFEALLAEAEKGRRLADPEAIGNDIMAHIDRSIGPSETVVPRVHGRG